MTTAFVAPAAGTAGALDFELPAGLEAHEPPEARGLTRDAVRLLVSAPGAGERHRHTTFSELPRFLRPGDLVVLNVSATVPAAVPADGGRHLLHLSTSLPGGLWLVELRTPVGYGTVPAEIDRERVVPLAGGGAARLLGPFPAGAGPGAPPRLWLAALEVPEGFGGLLAYLARWGRPIRYAYAGGNWPLSAYQNVYASEPGSAELPSAGRPFTSEVVTRLVSRGVRVAPLVLHTGVSSPEWGEPPYPEVYRVPLSTAQLVNQTRREGGRVVAVGTTVVRALETVADPSGEVHPGSGWTELVVTPERGVRVVSGLLTGWHPPQASHLLLLEAVAGRGLLEEAYAHAVAASYRWHEFGDSHLVLP
ncbi:MAG: S-adenosylmethionine:tRNA ribosyltransferase-isomerase [Actinobacteria bacterium]|nr:S-adenosylmethionine:tRNA ribosyltransferase-isomerase [Actinomycetota bacterium]